MNYRERGFHEQRIYLEKDILRVEVANVKQTDGSDTKKNWKSMEKIWTRPTGAKDH